MNYNQNKRDKWLRLTNPNSCKDYGLSMTRNELEKFDEGVEVLKKLDGVIQDENRQTEVMALAGGTLRDTAERMIYEILSRNALSLLPRPHAAQAKHP